MQLKILMSEQPHVVIDVNEWPILVTHARKEECLFVREHGDGRRLIHGTVTYNVGTKDEAFFYAGWLVNEKDEARRESETMRCVRRVAGRLALPQDTVDSIIARLPAIKL